MAAGSIRDHGPRLQEAAVDHTSEGLFRFVPNDFEVQPQVGKPEQDERRWERGITKVFDLLDFVDQCMCFWMPWYIQWVQHWTAVSQGYLMTQQACSMMAVIMLLFLPVLPAGKTRRYLQLRKGPVKICLALAVITANNGVDAVHNDGTIEASDGVPLPTDLELWMAGQQTLREQLEDSVSRWILEQPLQHNSGTAPEPSCEVEPPHAIAEPVQPAMEDTTLHVTIWLGAAYYEAETIDMELPVPLTLRYMKQALMGACAVIPDTFDDLCPTVPQLGRYYGSFIAQPSWLRDTDRTALVMDTRAVGGTAYVFYLEGRINVAGIMQQLPEYMAHEIDIYLFGARDRCHVASLHRL